MVITSLAATISMGRLGAGMLGQFRAQDIGLAYENDAHAVLACG